MLLCYFYSWFLLEGIDVFLEIEIIGISEVQGVKSQGEKSERAKSEVLKSDNRDEYTSSEFKEYLVIEGIEYWLSNSGRPEQNGIAERMKWTLTERARSIRLQADISEAFWIEVVRRAI